MSSCKLTYFNSQALAEAIRFLLHYGKIEFEDIRVDFEKDWPSYPKDTLPLSQLPILEIDGKVFYQSIAICRYLAKKVGLAGTNALEDYEIDNAVDNLNDFRASELCGNKIYVNLLRIIYAFQDSLEPSMNRMWKQRRKK